jgi:catechol 2,3-dioxygenase-like lactoylglutathione lyase family enzyme
MIRLRQIALVAADLERTTQRLCEHFGLDVCFRDPGVAEFGLANTVMRIGDQFLEVVSPIRDGTTAGRLLAKRDTDVSGYMVIHEVDDLDEREARLTSHGVRIVWRGDLPDIRGRHLHPADVGGAIVSIDQPVPPGAWRWGGPTWTAHAGHASVTGIAGAWIASSDPDTTRARWHELGLDRSVGFTRAGGHGDGLDVVDLVAADRSRAGDLLALGAVTIRLV